MSINYKYIHLKLKYIYLVTAYICVGLGLLGAFLPLLPTTPFLLAAMFLFAKSDPERARKLENSKLLGSYIQSYTQGKGMSLRHKLQTIIIMWATILLSIVFLVEKIAVMVILITIAIAVTIHIALLRPQRGKVKE